MSVIYRITNEITSKVYVGQTRNFTLRKAKHLCFARGKKNHPLYNAMRKYGLENFTFEVIEECTDDIVNEREMHWISYYNSCSPKKGYNLTEGGEGTTGYSFTDEAKEKIRQKALQRPPISVHTRQKLSDALKHRHRVGMAHRPDWTGKHHSEISKKKIGKANSIKQSSANNSQFGTVWVFHRLEKRSQRIQKEDLETFLLNGWTRGRKLSWKD